MDAFDEDICQFIYGTITIEGYGLQTILLFHILNTNSLFVLV